MSLADRQAALVASLVAGGTPPPGFASSRLAVTRAALLSKRAQEVGRMWPRLAQAYAGQWAGSFVVWADGRPTGGTLWDGWDFALAHPPTGQARLELRVRQALWVRRTMRRRRLPWLTLCREGVALQVAGRIRVLTLPQPPAGTPRSR